MTADPPSSRATGRRAEVVAAAVDLLRDGGPDALTSVAVAQRLGIAQSAVYRHVRTIEELRRLAADEFVADVRRALHRIIVSPELVEIHDIDGAFLHVIDAIRESGEAYRAVDRWRFEDGCLGVAIREVCAEFDHLIAALLEHHYRREFDDATPWSDAVRTAQLQHARHLQDEGYATARLVYEGGDCAELARVLRHRAQWGWISYVIDMHDRLGRERPDVDIDTMFP